MAPGEKELGFNDSFLTDTEQLVFNLHLWLCHFTSNRNVRVAIKGFQGFV